MTRLFSLILILVSTAWADPDSRFDKMILDNRWFDTYYPHAIVPACEMLDQVSGVPVPISSVNPLPVALITQAGKVSVNLARINYATTNVTTSAYTQLLAATSDAVTMLDIFDSSGQTLTLAVGAPGGEMDQIYIFKGGNGPVPLAIATGSRVSVKAVTATANKGELDVTFLK